MQIVRIQTNIRNVDIPDNIEEEVRYSLSSVMDLPPDKFLIIIEPAIRMNMGNRETPLAVVTLQTTRPSSQTENDVYAKKLTAVLREHLKLDPAHILISFDYKDAKNFAVQGKTIASLYV
uniref:Macrophage migration inhibitory factor n=1 Tax=Caenorhabditis japonica TaxID=281687 RepID=A0A8R1HWI0_CAEJA